MLFLVATCTLGLMALGFCWFISRLEKTAYNAETYKRHRSLNFWIDFSWITFGVIMAVYTLVIHLLDLPENLADASCIALLAPFVWSYTDSKKIFKGSSVPVGQILFNRAIMMIVPFLILRLFFGIVLKL